ncbi:MAG: S1 RNA-binding domain-containing protein [Clostridia bacterium]|nr:S1 RNA-binding domain-containing protein [Clostridia bacterium]
MQIEEGVIVSGKVTGLTDFGAFVELEGGKTGMIHISEVAPNYVKDIKEHLAVGQEVKAKVLTVSPEGKISLSIRKLNDQPKERDKDREREPRQPQQQRPQRPRAERRPAPNVWNGQKSDAPASGEKMSLDDMIASFKKQSEEKQTALKRVDSKRGSMGYSRRGSKQ